ncbi:RNA-binding protein [Rhodobacteraceae bacterium N5(2021)]|uniref:RNA-binding protein n=1 Tax=Gymnodinialimonas phycosphaerae TaxID=2841589 RepID=A0A975TU52_9RHOB|nr:RNA-binding protein [Gymnodinialimonas phycosphaerae]MBY4894126.1 RNA-binding protein [Gymnodinialimonas phycosphaerae]
MTRGGQHKDRSDGPERKCIATGEIAPKRGFIRFVVGPDGQVVADTLEKLPGRGMWVSADRAALELAVKKNLFSRAAKQQVSVPDDLVDRVETQLVRRVTDLIALCRKGGKAVAGFEKVKDWLANENVGVLLQASDGSERGKSKLWTPQGARYFGILTAQELGLAFGRQSVIHGALAAGGLSPRVIEDAVRLQGLRVADGGQTTEKDRQNA